MTGHLRGVAIAFSSAVLAAGLALPLHSATAAPNAPGVPTVRSTGYTWAWSDGGNGTRRTFTESIYGHAKSLPKLVVEASCSRGAKSGQRIVLQFRDSRGEYRTQDRAIVTNCNGTYKFSFIPYTTSGAWANGTYKYRLFIPGGGGYKYFDITYQSS